MDSDLQKVLFNIASAKAFTEGWHNNIARWRNLYDSKHYKRAAKPGEVQFNDPTHTNTVDLAVGISLSNPITWKATAWKPGADIQRLESQVEKFIIGVMESNIDRNEYDTNYEVLLHFIRDGGCVLYTVWDDDLAKACVKTEKIINERGEELPINVYNKCPVIQQVVDPASVYFLPGGQGRWLAVVRVEKVSVFDIYQKFGVLPKSQEVIKDNPTQMINQTGLMYDYWDVIESKDGKSVVRNAVLFESEFIPKKELIEMKKYKSIPYTLGLYKPTDRHNTGKWQSIITPLEEPVVYLEKNINRRQRQIDMYASLPLIAKTQSGRQVTLDPGLGKIAQLSTDEDIAFPMWPGNPPDVESQIEFARSRVQQSGFSDVFIGSGASQVSGFSLSQMGDQNRIRLEQPLAHLKRFWEWAGDKAVEVTIENAAPNSFMNMYGMIRGEPFAAMLQIEELKGFHITCNIQPNFPNDQVRKHAMGNQVRGILSEETIMEKYLDIQQPNDEYDRKILEMTQTHPLTIQFSIMKVLEEKANAGDEIAAAVIKNFQEQGAQGQPGAPKQPQNFEQGMGVPQGGAAQVGNAPSNSPYEDATGNPNMSGGV